MRLALASAFLAAPFFGFVTNVAFASASVSTSSPKLSAHSDAAPGPVRNVKIRWTNRSGGTATATLSWRAPFDPGSTAISSYAVSVQTLSCSPVDPSASALSCSINGLTAGASYDFTVTATNSVGSSTRVVHSTLNPQGQVITFPTLPDVTFNDSPVHLHASASSGLLVHYEATGACSVSGDELTFSSLGSCSVTARQVGDTQYQPASPVANFFVISKGTATLGVSGGKFASDGARHPAVVTVNPSASEISVQYCQDSGFGVKTCSIFAPREPGVYHVTVKLDSLLYSARPVSTVITISAPPATLPSNLLGFGSTPLLGATKLSKDGVVVHTSGTGFPAGDRIDVGAVSEESLGSFVIPSTNSVTAWLDLLRGSSSQTIVLNSYVVSASNEQKLSVLGSLAYPNGGFGGPGTYQLIELRSSGFIPHSTVSAVLHSNPQILSQAVANANGVVTIVVPFSHALAGQTHELFLTGTYLVTQSTAGADGSAPASITVSKALLSRLVPSAPLIMVFTDVLNPNLRTSNVVTLPTLSAFTKVVGGAPTPLHLARFKPIAHVNTTLKNVTGAAAALSAVAAGVAAARAASSVSGASAAASAASHTSSISSRGASAAHRASTETIEAIHHTHEVVREHVGDHSFTWRAPGREAIDEMSLLAPVSLAKFSPLAAVAIADAGYWRAMFGSLSLAFPLAGLALGTLATVQTHGYPLPPTFSLFLAITVLGFLDATAGITAATASLIGAVVTGHGFSLNMTISGLLLATLWFGMPIMVKKLRPFMRPHPRDFQAWWTRVADIVVGPAFAGFLAAKLVDSFSLVSNLKVGLVEHANTVGVVVALVAVARYFVATGVVFFYPRRLGEVTPPRLPHQSDGALVGSVFLRMGFVALLLASLLGKTWFVPPLTALVGFGMYVRAKELHVVLPSWAYRAIPRNIAKILLFEVVGTIVTAVLSQHVASPYWQIAGLLFAIFLLGLVLDLLSGARGTEWPLTWTTRLAGVALFLITVLQLSDNLITSG
jgi:hypothetical protein